MTHPTQPAHGASNDLYADIPSEYLVGLDRGHLGDWLQEVHDAGWGISILPSSVRIYWPNPFEEYPGTDDATHRVDVMILRAFLAWKEQKRGEQR